MDIQSLDMFSKLIQNGLGEMINNKTKSFATQSGQNFDINNYFEANRCKEQLSDDDMITLSRKTPDGYRAVFVTLGDLKKFLKV